MKTIKSISTMGTKAKKPRTQKRHDYPDSNRPPGAVMQGYYVSNIRGDIATVVHDDGKSYTVNMAEKTCTCDAGKHDKACKHQALVDWWIQQD